MKKIIRLFMMTLVFVTVFMASGSDISALAKDNGNLTVAPVRYTVLLNGEDYSLQAYTIDGSDFFKLRDIAMIMNGTTKQFQVEWDRTDNTIQITTGKAYNKTGGELKITKTSKVASQTTSALYINGNRTYFTTFCIDGNTYLKFSDIADTIGFSIDIDASSFKVSISGVQNAQSADEYVLTLIADNDEALLNGAPVTLPTPPFVQNGTFYIPLEAVTKMLGGTYSFEKDIATIKLFSNTTKYQIGSRSIIVNGEAHVVSGLRNYFSISGGTVAVDDKYVPVVLNGTVFIPVNYTATGCPDNGIKVAREYPESRMVILGGFEHERGINEVKLQDSYDNLSVNFRSQLHYTGVVGEVINYSIEEYKNDDLDVYVMRINKPHDDVEGMDGRVCAIKVVGNRYSTPRGLKTFDSAYRAWRLYGYEGFTNSFFYKVDGGIVSSFTFYTRYYGSQL